MKNNEEIDELFRQGIQKEYAYDESLWAQIEDDLPSPTSNVGNARLWKNSFSLLFILLFTLFLETDSYVSINEYSPRQLKSYADTPSRSTFNPLTNARKRLNSTPNNSSIQDNPNVIRKTINAQQTNDYREKKTRIDHKNRKETESNKNDIKPSQSIKKEVFETTEKQKRIAASNPTESIKSTLNAKGKSFPSIRKMSSLDFYINSEYASASSQSIDQNKLREIQDLYNKQPFYVEFEFGHSILINKVHYNIDANLEAYRNESEKSWYSQSIGLNFLTDFKRFTFGFGLHQSSYFEQINYSYDEEIKSINITYDTSYSVVNGQFNSNGTPVILIRENINENRNEVTERIDKRLVITNHFKRISLPFSIGYTKTFGRFNAGIRSAVVLNYLYASSGGYINKNRDQFYQFDEKEQLESWVIGNRNQLRLGYSLNEFVAIGTSLNHEQDLSSFTQNYGSKFNTYGLGVWLLYRPR